MVTLVLSEIRNNEHVIHHSCELSEIDLSKYTPRYNRPAYVIQRNQRHYVFWEFDKTNNVLKFVETPVVWMA